MMPRAKNTEKRSLTELCSRYIATSQLNEQRKNEKKEKRKKNLLKMISLIKQYLQWTRMTKEWKGLKNFITESLHCIEYCYTERIQGTCVPMTELWKLTRRPMKRKRKRKNVGYSVRLNNEKLFLFNIVMMVWNRVWCELLCREWKFNYVIYYNLMRKILEEMKIKVGWPIFAKFVYWIFDDDDLKSLEIYQWKWVPWFTFEK